MLGDIFAELVGRYGVSFDAAAVIHELDEGLPAVGEFVGHPPKPAKGSVDELRPPLLVQHDHAVLQVVDDRAQGRELRRNSGGLIAGSPAIGERLKLREYAHDTVIPIGAPWFRAQLNQGMLPLD